MKILGWLKKTAPELVMEVTCNAHDHQIGKSTLPRSQLMNPIESSSARSIIFKTEPAHGRWVSNKSAQSHQPIMSQMLLVTKLITQIVDRITDRARHSIQFKKQLPACAPCVDWYSDLTCYLTELFRIWVTSWQPHSRWNVEQDGTGMYISTLIEVY